MQRILITGLCAAALPALAGCQSMGGNSGLQREIAQIEARVGQLETDIATSTADISSSTAAVRTKMKYRPLVSWAEALSAGPQANRTISFRQTSKSGSLYRKREFCVLSQKRRDTRNAFIHEDKSTDADLAIKSITISPQPDGLMLTAPIGFGMSTQVAGAVRDKCIGGWTPTSTVGVSGKGSDTARFKLTLAQKDENTLGYNVDMVSPSDIDVEMRVDLGPFNVRWTTPMEGMLGTLAAGEIVMLYANQGEILLPDGRAIPYKINSVNPQFSTDVNGVELSSDAQIIVGDGT